MGKIIFFLVVFAAVLFFYHPALTTFFAQDDFFHIKISQTDGSLVGFLKLFGFYSFEDRGIAFYRPIFREVFFNIFYSLFGLNHVPYRVFAFVVHFVNIVLVYILLQKVFANRALSAFVSFFFAVTSANVATLYYLTGGIQSLGATMFILLALIFFFDYIDSGMMVKKWLAFATCLLALASHELSVVTPLLMSGLLQVKCSFKQALFRTVKQLWPLFLLLCFYFYLEVFVIGFSKSEQQYQAVLSPKRAVNTFSWYVGWSLGLPEMLIDFVRPGLELNPSLMRYWGGYFKVVFPAFFIVATLCFGSLVILFGRSRRVFADKRFWFFALWFLSGLLPVVFLPLHKSTYYLAPVLPAFWTIVGFLVLGVYSRLRQWHGKTAVVLLGIFLASAALLSFVSARLGESTYWAASRGKIALKLIRDLSGKYPTLPDGSAVYFRNDPDYPFIAQEWGSTSKQASFVLNGEDALHLLYKDPTLRVFYEDLGGVPEDFPKDKLVTVVAKLAQ